jgi:hypothetical protein
MKPQVVSRTSARWLTWAVLLLAWTGTDQAIRADSDPHPAAEFQDPDPDVASGQQRLVTIGIYLLIAVSVGSVSFLLILLLWGARVRRQVRQPLPNVRANDPLWYLKAKKHPPSEPGGPADVSDGKDQPPLDESSTP